MYYSLISSMKKSSYNVIDADAQAFITAASITDATQQTAINTLVISLKSYGIWTKMKALYPFVGGTASSHKFNLKDPRDLNAAFRLTFNGGWTHSSNGVKGNGTNSFINTYLIPSNIITDINSTSASLYFYENKINNGCALIARNTITGIGGVDIWRFNNNTYFSVNSIEIAGPVNTTKGNYLINRIINNQMKLFKNGTTVFTSNTSVTNLPNNVLILGAYGNDVSNNNYDITTYSFSHYGEGLTDAEASNFYTAVQAYQTSLSRQV